MSLLRNDSTTLAKDLPSVVNDDRPELETYGKLCNDRPNSADKEGMKNAMKQIDEVVGD
jgi:hypothetical protein